MSPHTVMEFTFIEFDTNWRREAAPPGAIFTPVEPATLWVVAEDHLGNKKTYTFKVEKEIVGVSYSENLVFIPAKCILRANGDTTKCSK